MEESTTIDTPASEEQKQAVFYIKQMVQMQEKINQKIHPDWRTQRFPWYRAIWTECAELMDHHGWKWWKKITADRMQIQLEIVDIWHFGLSDCLQFSEDESAIAHALSRVCTADTTANQALSSKNFLAAVETLAQACLSLNRFPLLEFSNLMQLADLDLKTLYRLYSGKNILNQFRQDFGYKTGDYQKLWNGQEDNVHLAEILNTLDPTQPSFLKNVYQALEARYPGAMAPA